jgi:hypothetical protein
VLDTSPVGALPDAPTVPTTPKITPGPVLRDADTASSHTQVHPAEAPTSTVRVVQALNRSPHDALPGVPEIPSVPDVSSAPAAQNVADTVPVTRAAMVPFSATSTTALPSPVADLLRPLGNTTLGSLPGVPRVPDGVSPLFSQLPVTRLTEAPSSAQPGVGESALRTAPLVPGVLGGLDDKASSALPMAQAAEVPSSVRGVPSLGVPSLGNTTLGALPGVASLPQAGEVVDGAATQVPMLRAAVQPVVSTAAVANSMPEATGVPSSIRRSANDSPLGAVPGVPRLPSVPSAGGLADDAVDVASSPTHVTQMAEVPTSDVNTSNLPSAPIGSVSYSPAGSMFGVPTVREAATKSLAAVPVQQMAQVPGTVSDSVNESPFTSLPGDPRVPSVPSVPELAVRTSSQPPVSYVTGAPSSAMHSTEVFGKPSAALPGVSDADGIAGVLPLVQDLFPRI